MRKIELIAPCHFGLEAVLKREIVDLGYEISAVEDGRVTFYGDGGCYLPGKYLPSYCRADSGESRKLSGGDF